MARKRRPKIAEEDLGGFRFISKLLRLLTPLHDCQCQRDRGRNRKLHFDQYTALLLLYFFNPIVTSLRGLNQASELKNVQRKLGCRRASLGSLSEAAAVFDPDLLIGIIGDLADKLKPLKHDARLDQVSGIITLVDGTLLPALPKLTEAMWLDEKHKAFKGHAQFELLKGVPTRIDITDANASERDQLAASLLPGHVYVIDRGYAAFWLFQAIIEAKSSFVCRLRDNSVYQVIEDRPLSDDAIKAGIVTDRIVKLGCESKQHDLKEPLRLVEVACKPHSKGTRGSRGGPQQGDTLLIATDLRDAPAEVIALIYKHRWAIEIFFRFFKHILGCRHLLSHNSNGIEIQTYTAIIACMLIALWTGRKPTLRTYEMICYYFTGLADLEEVLAHIARLKSENS
jgi:hypothetical protein